MRHNLMRHNPEQRLNQQTSRTGLLPTIRASQSLRFQSIAYAAHCHRRHGSSRPRTRVSVHRVRRPRWSRPMRLPRIPSLNQLGIMRVLHPLCHQDNLRVCRGERPDSARGSQLFRSARSRSSRSAATATRPGRRTTLARRDRPQRPTGPGGLRISRLCSSGLPRHAIEHARLAHATV